MIQEPNMYEVQKFKGFSKETIRFFHNLKKNNTRKWFNINKRDYETYVMEPAKAFVVEMGERLKAIFPHVIAVPRVNKSLFRINRDTRFSPDKSPYKTNLGIFFWEGTRPRMECAGFYFHLEPPNLMLGVGNYMFTKQSLDHYRRAVVDPESGAELSSILKKISKIENLEMGRKHYKRIPTGYDASHPNAEFLLFNGLYAGQTTDIPQEFYSRSLIDYCWKRFLRLAPLHQWLVSISIGQF